MALLYIAVVLCALSVSVLGHTYHLGGCPDVEPKSGFDMNKFLGKWYVIQKTSTGSRCLTYNFTATSEPGHYSIEQVSENPILGLASVDNKYHYTGKISTPSADTPAKMSVQFPLNVAGRASFIVFSTDYNNYGALFTCQKLAFTNRRSSTILSRTKTLDKTIVSKIRDQLDGFGVDPHDLSIIDQTKCQSETNFDGLNININNDTFSPKSIGGVVRKAGEKLGDGVEYVAEGAKKIYNTISSDKEREELIENQSNNVVEWLP